MAAVSTEAAMVLASTVAVAVASTVAAAVASTAAVEVEAVTANPLPPGRAAKTQASSHNSRRCLCF